MVNKEVMRDLSALYQQRREQAEHAAEQLSASLYETYPDLQEAEEKLSAAALERLSALLANGDPEAPARLVADQKYTQSLAHRDACLQRYRIAQDYSQPQYQCRRCSDKGFLAGRPCPLCYAAALEQVVASRPGWAALGEARFAAYDASLYSFGQIDKKAGEAAELIRREMELYAARFGRSDQAYSRKNLLFTGPPGSGKTFLASATVRALMERGFSVLAYTAPQLFRQMAAYRSLQQSFRPNESELEQAREDYAQLFQADLLFIDDLGSEAQQAGSAGDFLEILNLREQRGQAILISTNLSIHNLQQYYDGRVTSRLLGNFRLIEFPKLDLRLIKKKRDSQAV